MKTLKTLDVFLLAEELSDLIWNDFDTWPKKVQNTMGYQISNSADSISANIAEGYGRFHAPDRKRFYYYARGSFEETKSWIRKLYRRKIIDNKDIQRYVILINQLCPKLNSFINSTKK